MCTATPGRAAKFGRLLRADCYRLLHSRWLWIGMAAMLGMSLAFVNMQYTGMDDVAAMDRVVFLPLSFFGVISAALVSLLIGEDFSDGCIRNKLVAGHSRRDVFLSSVVISCVSCAALYGLMLAVTVSLGLALFEPNVAAGQLVRMIALGLGCCLVYGCIWCALTMLLANRTNAVVVCMALSFCMLFLALHTNQIVVQQPVKNGLPNPHYVSGFGRQVYVFLHDINPTGQAAQLSQMECHRPLGWLGLNAAWLVLCLGLGAARFARQDIR